MTFSFDSVTGRLYVVDGENHKNFLLNKIDSDAVASIVDKLTNMVSDGSTDIEKAIEELKKEYTELNTKVITLSTATDESINELSSNLTLVSDRVSENTSAINVLENEYQSIHDDFEGINTHIDNINTELLDLEQADKGLSTRITLLEEGKIYTDNKVKNLEDKTSELELSVQESIKGLEESDKELKGKITELSNTVQTQGTSIEENTAKIKELEEIINDFMAKVINTYVTKDDFEAVKDLVDKLQRSVDKGTEANPYIATTGTELAETLAKATSGDVYLEVTENVELPTTEIAIDGTLHMTLKGEITEQSSDESEALFKVTKGTVVFDGDGTARGDVLAVLASGEGASAVFNGGNYVGEKNCVEAANNGKLIIEGGSFTATTNAAVRAGSRANNASTPGSVEINGGTINGVYACVVFGESKLVVNGGELTSTDALTIMTNGSKDLVDTPFDITINGGTFNSSVVTESALAGGVSVTNKGTCTVNGGTFNVRNGVGLFVRSGELVVNGCTLNIDNDEGITGTIGDTKITIVANPVVIDTTAKYPGGDPSITNKTSYTTKNIDGTDYVPINA